MALPIESRVYGSPSIPQTQPVRPRPQTQGATADSTQRAAQNFVQTLPSDVREQLNQVHRDNQKKNNFSNAQKSAPDNQTQSVNTDEAAGENARTASQPQNQRPAGYSLSGLAPSSTLFQAQLSAQQNPYTPRDGLSTRQHETYHDAYLSAGAQPGGRTAALEAALVREELSQQTLIVPPILTQVNFSA